MKNRGFTLIELLLVISIIGLLASMILLSLSSARNKSKDTRIGSDIRQLRIQIESDNAGQSNYGVFPAGSSFNSATSLINSGNYATLTTDISANNGALTVVTNGASPVTAYALYGTLNTGKYFCTDSLGNTNLAATTNTTVVCP